MEESGSSIFRHFRCSTDYFKRCLITGAVEAIFAVGKKIGAGIFRVDSKAAFLECAVIGYIHEGCPIPQTSQDGEIITVI